MATYPEALTASVTLRLARLVQGCIDHAKCARLRQDDGSEFVVTGTMRAVHVSPSNQYMPGPSTDIRGCFVWVTLSSGLEAWWPVVSLLAELEDGTFACPYDGPGDAMTDDQANTTYEGYEAWRQLHAGEVITHGTATARFNLVPEDTVIAWAERFIYEHGYPQPTRPYSSPVAALAPGDSSRYTATSGRRADRKE